MNKYLNPFQTNIVPILLVAVGLVVAVFFGILYGAPRLRRYRTRRAGQEKARRKYK